MRNKCEVVFGFDRETSPSVRRLVKKTKSTINVTDTLSRDPGGDSVPEDINSI